FAFYNGVTTDISLVFQHIEHAFAQARAGRNHFRLVAHLSIADARQQIAERIIHRHRGRLPTSSTSAVQESAPSSRVLAAQSATFGPCGKTREAARSAGNDCESAWPKSYAAVRRV